MKTCARTHTKAAEDSRTPGRFASKAASNVAGASWSAAVLCRFGVIFALAFSAIPALAPIAAPAIEFRAVDIFIESQTQVIAAYQLDWSVVSRNATIVGIEGGEHPAFREAPYYDPKAIQQERVIVAAFNVNSIDQLPTGKTRITTIHLQTKAGAQCEYKFQKFEAAAPDGHRISIEVSARERNIL